MGRPSGHQGLSPVPRCLRKPRLGSEAARQARGFAAIAFYALMSRKLQAGGETGVRRDQVRARPRAFRAREPEAPRPLTCPGRRRGSAIRVSRLSLRSRPRCALPGERRPPPLRGPSSEKARAPRAPGRKARRRRGQTGPQGPETLGFPRPRHSAPLSPCPFTCARASGERAGGTRATLALPGAGLGGVTGACRRARPGLVPPEPAGTEGLTPPSSDY